MTQPNLVRHLCDLGPFSGEAEAKSALLAVLSVLRARLFDDEVRPIAAALSPDLAEALGRGQYEADFPLADFYQRVAAQEGINRGRAIEHAQLAAQLVFSSLPGEVGERLLRHLPDYETLFVAKPEPEPPSSPERHPTESEAAGSTLASGRAGSTNPLSTGRPPDAHRHSVAKNDDPHADTKLSSSPGITQVREGRTLASAHPPERRK